ncbi:cytochrome P450 27C1 isoform X3 [Cuculus canorus]|uniref:cytochrome P450 27C1 isoform X3 n=1 Tax=Cuculus canorus TaxID=55661 RepID=UPI0023AAD636|nr:cytochrome P450 27C1 isoform X3 [Cuculus canorus]
MVCVSRCWCGAASGERGWCKLKQAARKEQPNKQQLPEPKGTLPARRHVAAQPGAGAGLPAAAGARAPPLPGASRPLAPGQRRRSARAAAAPPGQGQEPARNAGAQHSLQPLRVLLEGRLRPHPRDSDRDMVAQVLRAEGRAPQRANMESWQEYRDLRGRATGLISAEGEQWLKMRSVLRQKILKPEDVAVYSEGVNEVITDLIKRIHTLRSQEDDGETVTNVNNLFFKYSMEGQIHVDNKLKSIQSQLDRGEAVNGGLLTHLLVSKALTLEEIYANMTEMLLAGVDTTSFTLSWATYLLAKHPEVQQRVYEEIVNKLGKNQVPVAHDVPKLPLIRAVLKETLRLYPVLPGNGRVTQKDLIVGGYLIPKGTQLALCHYTTSYSEENFSMANEFRPERWLRKDNLDRVDNFGSIPFGYGIRSCIGKRIAELEIHLALIQLLQNFEIKISPKTKPVRAKTHGLLTPGNSINVRFSDRK